MTEVVIASKNQSKVSEIRHIMEGLPISLLTNNEVGDWAEVEETGFTYFDNALIKARAVAAFTGKAALADDSGIEVDALDGRPGVHSARFAGPEATDEQNNVRLASLLFGVPLERRTARYRCVALLFMPGGKVLTEEGVCEGSIAMEPKGFEGFGYDPWFYPAGSDKTMAEHTLEEKEAISHRGLAFRALRSRLADVLTK